jgi:hypothetical protein
MFQTTNQIQPGPFWIRGPKFQRDLSELAERQSENEEVELTTGCHFTVDVPLKTVALL